jgi:hypothetical protein
MPPAARSAARAGFGGARRNRRVPRGNAKLASNKGECCFRNDLARAQQAPGIAESAELQRETKLVRVAATTFYGGEIGNTQGPVPDQFGYSARSGTHPIPLARPPEFVVCPLMCQIQAFRYFWPFRLFERPRMGGR